MPKRSATPPIDDGAKYLTVVFPYPSRPNMELDSHRKLFVQWVAACIGAPYLRAFYHKPTSPGSIIMEIEDTLPDFAQILGAHKWSQFLTTPQGDDAKHVSKVFYCTYNSDRLVQKNGWKRVDVKDGWFKSKGPSKFVSTYPRTQWCDIPKVGDVIQNYLCRPLPGADFPPPPPPGPEPVVGSLEWLEHRRQLEAEARIPRVKTWARGTPPESLHSAPTTTPNQSTAPSKQAAQPASGHAYVAGGPAGGSPVLLRANSAVSSRGSSNGGTRSNHPSHPLLSSRGPHSSTSSTSGDGSDTHPLSPTDLAYNRKVTIAGVDVEGALNALSLGEEDEYEDDFYSVQDASSTCGEALQSSPLPATPAKDSLWDDYLEDEDDNDPEDNEMDLVRAAAKKPGLCRAHNRVCKRGICKLYAAQLREEEKEKRKVERRQQQRDAQTAREARKKKNDSDEDAPPSRGPPRFLRAAAPAQDTAPPRQLPPHLRRGAAPASTPSPSPVSPVSPPVRATSGSRPPSNAGDDARSVSSSGWGSVGTGVWGAARAKAKSQAPDAASGAPPAPAANAATDSDPAGLPASATAPPRAWGAWGRAPSVTASSVQRNNDSWSVSAPHDNDAQSIAGRSEASGWGTKSDRAGPWGSTDAVRAAGSAGKKGGAKSNNGDGRSVAGSTVSASTARSWGNVSAGPW